VQFHNYIEKISKKRNVEFDNSVYPFNIPAIKNFSEIKLNQPVTFIIGENGIGKSTLLEAIAIHSGFNPEGGSKNFLFNTRETHSCLSDYLTISRSYRKKRDGYFLRAESFYNLASEIERLDEEPGFGPPITPSYGGVSLHKQSHGESFFSLFFHRLGGDGLYIFDEPEAALSPMRQLAMLSRVHELVKLDSQFIIATHSPILMAYPYAEIYEVSETGIAKVNYQDTEHYRISKYFLNNTDRMLSELLALSID